MKKYILLILFVFVIPLFGQTSDEPKSLVLWDDGCGGLNTKDVSFLIGDNEFTELQNCFTDEISGLNVRGRFVTSAFLDNEIKTPVRFLYNYTKQNGDCFKMAVSSNTLMATISSSHFLTIYSTLPANSVMWATTYNDNCYLGCHDGDRWTTTNGTSTVEIKVSTAIPQVRYMICAYNKLIGANINSTNQGSRVVYSNVISTNILMSSDWGEMDWIEIDRDNGENITGIFMYKGNIYVTKPSAIYILTGLDDSYNTNDGFYQIVNGVGCISQQTIQELDGLVYFAGINGIYAFDGNSVVLVSKKIEPDYFQLEQIKNYYTINYATSPLCAIAIDDRYWISGSSTPDETNNVIFVLDHNKNWIKMENLCAASFAIFSNNLNFGSSYRSATAEYSRTGMWGYRYALENYDTYKGITERIHTIAKTKDFNLGTSLSDKNLTDFWVSFATMNAFSSSIAYRPTIKYNINISSEAFTLPNYYLPLPYYDKIPINLNIKQPFDRFRYINFAIYDFRELYGIVAFYNISPRLQ